MAKFSLILFDNKGSNEIGITAELNQNTESIFLSFSIKEGLDKIDFGNPTPNKNRVIKLWEKTCFEFFIKNQNESYVEFNFSPNFEWNCFFFDQKGNPLKEWEKMQRPSTDVLLSLNHFFIVAEIRKEFFPKGFFDGANKLQVGITSVIKDKSGSLSYWALAHCDTRPNFHDFRSFFKFV